MKAKVSRFFATVGAAFLWVFVLAVALPAVILTFGWVFWLALGLACVGTSFAIDHWPSRSAS